MRKISILTEIDKYMSHTSGLGHAVINDIDTIEAKVVMRWDIIDSAKISESN